MKHTSRAFGLNALLDIAANVTRKSLIDRYAAFAIQNMAAETGCGARNRDDFISWLSHPYLDLCKKEAVLRHIHPVRVEKGRAVTPQDRSQSNVSATFRFRVAVRRVHKGSHLSM